MKKLFIFLLLLCLVLPLLASCLGAGEAPTTTAVNDQNAQIAELMRQLDALRSDNREQDEEYRKLLAELQAALDALSAQSGTKPSTGTNDAEAGTDDPNGTSTSDPGRFIYETNGTYATITGFTGKEDHITVPSRIDGYTVTAIGERAFASASCKSVTVSAGILSIDWFAFYGCLALKEISLPESVIDIGYGAFDGCAKGLTLICAENSYALSYAKSYGFTYLTSQ